MFLTTRRRTRLTTETVPLMPLVTYAARSVRVDRHAARLFANADFGQLYRNVIAIRIFHLND